MGWGLPEGQRGDGETTGTAGRQGVGVLASSCCSGNQTQWREEATLWGWGCVPIR